ncbi:NirA family protein [Roseiconus nitratireducens]|uniref:NirA family protein n=1 Tax=Roseiconus nitratireducens TaxID=2605748 RepID=A0A5M6CZ57_9BACT|nr:NirA family protein [Roseiconus nitratireducens]KAA5539700.1 NirA family protein [Roseiconus nitratireducens]
MSNSDPFTEAQKQYLAGFTMGSDVARAVSKLPVLSNSVSNGATISLDANGVSLDGNAVAAGPDRFARIAQQKVKQNGGKLSKEEQAKADKNPLDMWDEIIARSDAGEFPKGTDVFLHKFHGMFYVAPNQNAYMMRLRIPGGMLRSWQLRGLADLSETGAGGYIDVTTRANLQLREIPDDGARRVLYGIRDLDLISLGSGGDNIRNCTASCLSGIDPDELVETIPLAKRMHHYILNHREMYGLPRKFNIAFDGGGQIAALEDTNDIGFRAVEVSDEHADESLPAGVYFQLTLGGITGHKDFARDTGVLLTGDECVEVAGAIVRVFIQHGDRTDRNKARLKYVLDDWGFDKFLTAVEEEWGRPLRRIDASRVTLPHHENRLAHVDFHRQRQADRHYVGIVLPVGRMTASQAREIAALADEYGQGEVRLTVWQNLILPHLRTDDLEAIKSRIEGCGLHWRATNFRAGLVACTGSAGCKYAGADTKANAMTLAKHLEDQFDLDLPINIHFTGCHHSCAQHYIGDIGLIACKVEQGEDTVDGYHIVLGGGWGDRQGIGREIFQSVAFDAVPPLVAALIGGYLETRSPDEPFVDFVRRSSDESLREMATTTA